MGKIFPFHPPKRAALRAPSPTLDDNAAAAAAIIQFEEDDARIIAAEREERRREKIEAAKLRQVENDFLRRLEYDAERAFPWQAIRHLWPALRRFRLFSLKQAPGRPTLKFFPTAMVWAAQVIGNEKGFELFSQVRPGVSEKSFTSLRLFTPYPLQSKPVLNIVRLFVRGRVAVNPQVFGAPDHKTITEMKALAKASWEIRKERLKDARRPNELDEGEKWLTKELLGTADWIWLNSATEMKTYVETAEEVETLNQIKQLKLTPAQVIERLKQDVSISEEARQEMIETVQGIVDRARRGDYGLA